jgi:hypothetical protein
MNMRGSAAHRLAGSTAAPTQNDRPAALVDRAFAMALASFVRARAGPEEPGHSTPIRKRRTGSSQRLQCWSTSRLRVDEAGSGHVVQRKTVKDSSLSQRVLGTSALPFTSADQLAGNLPRESSAAGRIQIADPSGSACSPAIWLADAGLLRRPSKD